MSDRIRLYSKVQCSVTLPSGRSAVFHPNRYTELPAEDVSSAPVQRLLLRRQVVLCPGHEPRAEASSPPVMPEEAVRHVVDEPLHAEPISAEPSEGTAEMQDPPPVLPGTLPKASRTARKGTTDG